MLNLWASYKWIFAGIGLLIWSMGVWNISAGYTENTYTKEKLATAVLILENKESNDDLKADISKSLQETLSGLRPQVTTINKEIQREILTNHVYSDCKSTDDIVLQYEQKLNLQ